MASKTSVLIEHPRFDRRRFRVHRRQRSALRAMSPQGQLVADLLVNAAPRDGVMEGAAVRRVLERHAGEITGSTDPTKVFQDQRARFERAGFLEVLRDSL